MMLRNKGGAWRRRDNTVVAHGEIFVPTPRELESIRAGRQIGIRFEEVKPEIPFELTEAGKEAMRASAGATPTKGTPDSAETTKLSAEKTTQASPSRTEEPPKWPMQMRPALYLKLHPKGQHAELARKVVEHQQTAVSHGTHN